MKFQLWMGFLLVGVAAVCAQPQHDELLYSHELDSAINGQFAEFYNRNGEFISGEGWHATSEESQLFIVLPEDLPKEGTLVLDVTNFNPVEQNSYIKHQIVNMYSLYNGDKAIFDTDGSWWNIRTGSGYSDGEGMAGFKFLGAAKGIDTRLEARCMQSKSDWNKNETYEFRVIWTTSKIYYLFDGVVQSVLDFNGQVEKFQFIYIGKDNVFYPAMAGPIYKNLRIYGKEQYHDYISFYNITSSSQTSGFSSSGYGHGVSFADVDNDGLKDILVSNAVRYEAIPDMLFRNKNGSQFEEVAASRGLGDEGLTHSIVSADFNNDGYTDAFYSNMSAFPDRHLGLGRNALYLNNSKGDYNDISDWANISTALKDSRGAIALDVNNDGWQDIYAVTWGDQNEFYINQGNGSMVAVDHGAIGPVGDASEQQGVTAADFDNDGDVDIYICVREAANRFYINDGTGHFTERAAQLGVAVDGRSHGATFGDVDNDGDLDLFVMNYAYSAGQLPSLYYFENNGNGGFIDRTTELAIDVSGYSTLLGDVDNDTDLDLFVIRNSDKQPGAAPELYLNNGSGQFTSVLCGIEVQAMDPRGAGLGDIDNDGDLDLYMACKDGYNFLLRNDQKSYRNYIDVLCVGPLGDQGGFGTKVTIYEPGYLGNSDHILGYQESVSNYSYLCQNQTALHFGLKNYSSCDIRIVQTNGRMSDFQNVSANQTFEMQNDFEPQLLMVSGNNQNGFINAELVEPLVVRIVDDNFNPVSNIVVDFAPQDGGEIVEQQPIQTDSDGYASAHFKFGSRAGDYRIVVTSNLTQDDQAVFTVTAASTPPQSISCVTDLTQPVQAGELLEIEFQVLDTHGNPYQGQSVELSVTSGGGSIQNQQSITRNSDENGRVQVAWLLGGNHLAINEIEAVAEFNGQPLDGSPISVVPESVFPPDFSGSTLAATSPVRIGGGEYSNVTVTLKNANGVPLNGYGVNLYVSGDENQIQMQADAADANGKIQAHVTSMQTGRKVVTATVKNVNSTVPDSAEIIFVSEIYGLYELAVVDGNFQKGAVGQQLDNQLMIQVKNKSGNPVANVDILYHIHRDLYENEARECLIKTNAEGKAAFTYRLGKVAKNNSDSISVYINDDQFQKVVFFQEAQVGPPNQLVKVSGDNQQYYVGKSLLQPFVVTCADTFGNPITNHSYKFSITEGNGNFSGQQEVTVDTTIAVMTLGTQSGVNKASVQIVGSDLPPVYFTAIGIPHSARQPVIVSGNNQNVFVTKEADEKLVCQLQDQYGNPVPGAQATFSAVYKGEVLSPQPMTTDSLGMCSCRVAAGDQKGKYDFKVEVESGGYALFTMNVYGSAYRFERITADTLLVTSEDQEIQLALSTLDVKNRPLADVNVKFSISKGNGTFVTADSVVTGTDGIAATTVLASISEGPVTFTATSVLDTMNFIIRGPNTPKSVNLISFTGQVIQNRVLLKWQTAREINNLGFYILKSESPNGEFVRQGSLIPATPKNKYEFIDNINSHAQVLYYKLQDVSRDGEITTHDAISVMIAAPEQCALLQNYPNPFNGSTTIPFEISETTMVKVVVYNLSGQQVATLADGVMQPGKHKVQFDPLSSSYGNLSSGVYYYMLKTDSYKKVKELLYTK